MVSVKPDIVNPKVASEAGVIAAAPMELEFAMVLSSPMLKLRSLEEHQCRSCLHPRRQRFSLKRMRRNWIPKCHF